MLPNSIERIEDAAFKDCRVLKQIDLSCATGLVFISKSAFSGCSQLKEVVLPNSIERIEDTAFKDCRTLEQIDLSCATRLVSISKNAFLGCKCLERIVFSPLVDVLNCYPRVRDPFPSDVSVKICHNPVDSVLIVNRTKNALC